MEVTNLSHKTVVAHQTEEEQAKAAEMVRAAWKKLRPKTNALRQGASREVEDSIKHKSPPIEKIFKAKHSSEGEYKDTRPDTNQNFDLGESLHEKMKLR